MSEFAKTQKDLRNVLLYTEELLSFYDRIVYDVSAEPHPSFHEAAVARLEGVETDIDEETWLRIRRLREIAPPEPDEVLKGWVFFGQQPSPEKQPRLIDKRLLNFSIEEISDLCEAGLIADLAHVMQPVGADEANPDHKDVILYMAHMPELRALWQAYLDGPWAEWAKIEGPRRRSINLYNKLYQILQRIQSLGDDNPIDLVFGVGIACWKVNGRRISAPIIEQLVELDMDEDGAINVRPRTIAPSLVLKAFHALEIEGSKALQRDAGAQFERMLDDPDIGFSPFDQTTFETILRSCAARLSSTGIYLPDEQRDPDSRNLPAIDGTLRITDTWVLYVRQRMEDVRRNDIRNLIGAVERAQAEQDLPKPAIKFIMEPNDELIYDSDGSNLEDTSFDLPEFIPSRIDGSINGPKGIHNAGSSAATGTEHEIRERNYLFPLPFNEDQIEIVKRLDEAEGVVVQGPPGTGKTHTIANIICHYMATGKRVLVTAKTPEALTALQEKLPESIRNVTISVIHNDREGARQLQQAVDMLANEAKQINLPNIKREIASKQARLAELRNVILQVDHDLLS